MVSVMQAWLSGVQGLSSYGCSQHVSWGCSYLKAQMEEDFLQTHLYGSWLVLDGICPSHPLLATEAFHGATHCSQHSNLLPPEQKFQRGREERQIMSKMEVTVFRSLILEVTFHHFCHIIFVRSKTTLSPAHTQEDHTRCKH